MPVLKEPISIRYEIARSHLKDITVPREQTACLSGANQDHRLLTVFGSDLGKTEGCGSNPSLYRLEVAACSFPTQLQFSFFFLSELEAKQA